MLALLMAGPAVAQFSDAFSRIPQQNILVIAETPEGLYIGGGFDQLGNVFSSNVGPFTGHTVFINGFEDP